MFIQQFAILASVSLSVMTAAIPASRAATPTAAISVSATVAAFCQVGPRNDRAGATGRADALAVNCSMSVPYSVTVEDGSTMPTDQTQTSPASNAQSATQIAATVTY